MKEPCKCCETEMTTEPVYPFLQPSANSNLRCFLLKICFHMLIDMSFTEICNFIFISLEIPSFFVGGRVSFESGI